MSPDDDATGGEDEDEDEPLPSTSSSCKSSHIEAVKSQDIQNTESIASRSPKSYTKLPSDVRVCLTGDCASDNAVCAAARLFGYPVVTDPQCKGVKDENDLQNGGCTVYVMREFAGEAYDAIHKTRHRCVS